MATTGNVRIADWLCTKHLQWAVPTAEELAATDISNVNGCGYVADGGPPPSPMPAGDAGQELVDQEWGSQ